jgi:hypothetical protein
MPFFKSLIWTDRNSNSSVLSGYSHQHICSPSLLYVHAFVRNRNCLLFSSTCLHHRYFSEIRVVHLLSLQLCFLFCFVWFHWVSCPKLPMSLDCQFVVAPSVFSNVYAYGDMILKRPLNFRLCYEIDRGGSEDQKEVWVEWLLHRSDVTSKGWNLHGQVSFNVLRFLLTLMDLFKFENKYCVHVFVLLFTYAYSYVGFKSSLELVL